MEIKQAKYFTSSPSVDQCPKPDRPEFAFIGRSNVGKSSLINMLCNNKKLAKISATPGKTKLINHFEILSSSKNTDTKWYVVDLPGYGFAKSSQGERKSWHRMTDDYIQKRPNLINLFVLIDSRLPPQKIDIEFINRLGSRQIPFSLIFTKADKNKEKQTLENVQQFMQELQHTWEELPAYFITSAPEKRGRKELLDFIDKLRTSS